MPVTYSLSADQLTITGYSAVTPCLFKDVYTADKAGSIQLKTGTPAMNMTLTQQIKPTDKLALKIDFVLSGTNAGAGDTIVITGTDAWDNAQSETLATVADGTYTTTKYFKTITDIDCTGFDTGTLVVNQNQWGVIWWHPFWDAYPTIEVADHFRVDCPIVLDGHLKSINEVIDFNCMSDVFTYSGFPFPDGYLYLGELSDADKKTGHSGSIFRHYGHLFDEVALEAIYAYNSVFMNVYGEYGDKKIQVGATIGRIWNCVLRAEVITGNAGALDIYNTEHRESDYAFHLFSTTGEMERLRFIKCNHVSLVASSFGITLRNALINEYEFLMHCMNYSAQSYLIDWDTDWANPWEGEMSLPGRLFRQYSFNLKVIDRDNEGIGDATVELRDKDDNVVFSVQTVASGDDKGKIAEQIVSYGYYLDDTPSWVSYSPHILKITKTGYEEIETVCEINAKIEWVLAMTDPCYAWTVDKINEHAASGFDHTEVANYPMSWDDGGNILTIWGDDGNGGKEAMGWDTDNEIVMEHVWAFSAYTKGTCICTKDSDDAFTMKARLKVGDGTEATFFATENQSVWQYDYFKVKNNAVMRMGSIATDASNPYPDPKWGSCWTIDRVTLPDIGMPARCYFVEDGGELYVYDSRIALTDNSKAFDTEIGTYTFIGFSTFAGYDRLDATFIRWWGVLEFDHMTLHHCRNMNFPTPPHADSAYLNIYDNQNDLQVRDAESWIYDATLSNAITCACKTLAGGMANLVDPIGLDYDKICTQNVGTWQKLWHRFARRVIDESGAAITGARVQVWNQFSVSVYDEVTDGTGWTAMQLVKEWETNGTGPNGITYPDDFILEGPFTTKVSKDDTNYLTVEETIDISQRMDNWEVTLMDASDIIDGINDIKGLGFVKDTHSLTDIQADTNELQTNQGDWLTATGFATIDDIYDEVMEGTITFKEAIRLCLSVLAGQSNGGGSSFVRFRDMGDTKNRIVATVDDDGNRISVTRDGS